MFQAGRRQSKRKSTGDNFRGQFVKHYSNDNYKSDCFVLSFSKIFLDFLSANGTFTHALRYKHQTCCGHAI